MSSLTTITPTFLDHLDLHLVVAPCKNTNRLSSNNSNCNVDYLAHKFSQRELCYLAQSSLSLTVPQTSNFSYNKPNITKEKGYSTSNKSRLINSVNRKWMQNYKNLKKLNPTVLHWNKEFDSYFLYGPKPQSLKQIQTSKSEKYNKETNKTINNSPETNNPKIKPILKSYSEIKLSEMYRQNKFNNFEISKNNNNSVKFNNIVDRYEAVESYSSVNRNIAMTKRLNSVLIKQISVDIQPEYEYMKSEFMELQNYINNYDENNELDLLLSDDSVNSILGIDFLPSTPRLRFHNQTDHDKQNEIIFQFQEGGSNSSNIYYKQVNNSDWLITKILKIIYNLIMFVYVATSTFQKKL